MLKTELSASRSLTSPSLHFGPRPPCSLGMPRMRSPAWGRPLLMCSRAAGLAVGGRRRPRPDGRSRIWFRARVSPGALSAGGFT